MTNLQKKLISANSSPQFQILWSFIPQKIPKSHPTSTMMLFTKSTLDMLHFYPKTYGISHITRDLISAYCSFKKDVSAHWWLLKSTRLSIKKNEAFNPKKHDFNSISTPERRMMFILLLKAYYKDGVILFRIPVTVEIPPNFWFFCHLLSDSFCLKKMFK